MTLRSVYVFNCVCGKRYEVEAETGFTCACGRVSEIAWSAEKRISVNRAGSSVPASLQTLASKERQ